MQNLLVTPESAIPQKYTLGLDIGMASAGAALLAEDRILALHVRAFDKAETPDGESLNSIRRNARLTRRRLRRRAHRLLRLCRLLKRHGLIESAVPEAFAGLKKSPWLLRAEGLDRLLARQEWAAVLYHIVKHRGFQSNRKSEAAADEKVGQMLGGVNRNRELLAEARRDGIRTHWRAACATSGVQQGQTQQGTKLQPHPFP